MAVETTGQITLDVDRAAAFARIGDPLLLAQCIPGCTDLRELSPGRYSAILTNNVAFITLRFKVIVEIVKIDPPNGIEAKISGDAIGVPGRVVASAALELFDAGDNRTNVRYTASLGLAGKLGGLGEPIFRAKSAEVARQFGANLKAAIEK